MKKQRTHHERVAGTRGTGHNQRVIDVLFDMVLVHTPVPMRSWHHFQRTVRCWARVEMQTNRNYSLQYFRWRLNMMNASFQ